MNEYHADKVYLESLKDILDNGKIVRNDRTGVGTIKRFGGLNRYDLTKGFPLLTSKKLYTRGIFGELVWFLQGRTDNEWLTDRNIHIWDEWSSKVYDDMGPIYSWSWRYFGADYVPQAQRDAGAQVEGGVDQILEVLNSIKNNPFSRRHIVIAWNPNKIDEMALPPCHALFQFDVTPDENGNPYGLSCELYQRSADTGLGEPFNIASYAALTHLFADLTGLVPLEFIHTFGDHHVYLNHIDQLKEQISREDYLPPMPGFRIDHPFDLKNVDLSNPDLFKDYKPESFVVENYHPLPGIKMDVAV